MGAERGQDWMPIDTRRCDRDPRLPSQKKTPRSWRTREDPLADIWDADILPLLEAAPGLKAVTLLEELERRYPDRPWASSRRTLERRIRDWKALEGPDKEVIFRQANPPPRYGRPRKGGPAPAATAANPGL